MTNIQNQKGFTLIEVVIALGVLSFGILALMLMQLSGIRGNSVANTITSESNWAADRIEQSLRLDFFDGNLADTDGDGTNQDTNEDGIDDNAGNFGLDDIGTSTPAGCTAAPADFCTREGLYDIFWNVAIDYPVIHSKTLKIIVRQNQGKSNQVVFEYVKADII